VFERAWIFKIETGSRMVSDQIFIFGNVLECSRMFWNVLECSRMFSNVREHFVLRRYGRLEVRNSCTQVWKTLAGRSMGPEVRKLEGPEAREQTALSDSRTNRCFQGGRSVTACSIMSVSGCIARACLLRFRLLCFWPLTLVDKWYDIPLVNLILSLLLH
jgi:hypothetical protein